MLALVGHELEHSAADIVAVVVMRRAPIEVVQEVEVVVDDRGKTTTMKNTKNILK